MSGLTLNLTYKDHQQYFLYGSMVYMALKEWDKALHLLSIVTSSPSDNVVSLVMVDAYKKWILVGLVKGGKVSLPGGMF